jgi:UDP:flavonoid glycosyltransferase YjiC (YdhE family)
VADRGASVSQLRAAIQHVLESAHYRRHARTMRSALNAYEDGARAVKLLDDLARQ